MEAIIISGMPAAGKTTVSNILASKLGLKVIGAGDMLKEMAFEKGYTPGGDDWWDSPEGIKFAKERAENPDFDKEVDKRLTERIKKGNVIITSYTAPWITEMGFKVWLSCSTTNRAKRMAERDNTEIKETLGIVKIRDRENSRIYMNLYNINFGRDLKPFNLIVETDNVPPEEVADMIIKKLKERERK